MSASPLGLRVVCVEIRMSSAGNKNKTKLPNQLVALIQGEEAVLQEDGFLVDDSESPAAPTGGTKHTANQIVAAAQGRHLKELSSYVRAICMRLGFAE